MRSSLLVVVLFLGLAGAIANADDCKLSRVASMDMKIDAAGGMSVPMKVQGTTVEMLIDTGGIYSMLRNEVVASLGLRMQPIDTFRYRMTMMGGRVIKYYVDARDVFLGNMHADSIVFMVMPEGTPVSSDMGGTLSPDILSNFDVDFDMARAKVNLFSQDHCPGRVIYWTKGPVAIVPISKNEYGQFDVDLTLDGKELKGVIDTGSSRSFMNYEDAKSLFAWADNDPKLKADGDMYRYPFSLMQIKGIAVNNPDIMLFPYKDTRLDTGGKIILGMGILRQLHIYIAYRERNLYLSAADDTN